MTAKTMIYIVRHGETDWNIENKMQGHTDIPLNKKGRTQAKEIALHLKDTQLDIIYSSPLSRAYETASIINIHHKKKILTDTALRERQFGELEGKTYEEVNAYHPALVFPESWKYPHYRPPEGESLGDMEKRISLFMTKLLKKSGGKTVLLVTHGVALRILISVVMKLPLEQVGSLHHGNAALSIIEITNGELTLHVANYQAQSV